MRTYSVLVLTTLLLIAVLAKSSDSRGQSSVATAGSIASQVVDRIDSPGVQGELADFRRTSGDSVAQLTRGATSRDSLIMRYARALDESDTTALRALTLTPREFAWISYPASAQSRPPYELDPAIMWMQIQARSARGMARAVREYGNGALGYVGNSCSGGALREGAVSLYNSCRITHRLGQRQITEQLFGSIIEHGGQYKFAGLSNRL